MARLDALEADLALERERLRARLDEAAARLKPAAVVAGMAEDAKGLVFRASDRIGSGVLGPMAASAASLALTLAASKLRAARDARSESPPRIDYDHRVKPVARGLPDHQPDPAGFDARLAQADAKLRRSASTPSVTGEHPMSDTAYTERPYPNGAASTLSDKAKARFDDLRSRIDDGLEGWPEAARERVRRAREAAIAAQSEIEARARRTASAARNTARENPLLIGALAFAAGAALAAALPRTSTENRAFGATRDRLFDEAERIYREERAKLTAAAEEALENGRAKVAAALDSTASAAADTAQGERPAKTHS